MALTLTLTITLTLTPDRQAATVHPLRWDFNQPPPAEIAGRAFGLLLAADVTYFQAAAARVAARRASRSQSDGDRSPGTPKRAETRFGRATSARSRFLASILSVRRLGVWHEKLV